LNLVLFDPAEILAPLPRSDPRARHVLDVLRRKIGDTFDAGLVDGPRGKATVTAINEESLGFSFVWGAMPAPLPPITVLIGLPRPQTARKILQDATTLGVAALHFVTAERAEPSYGDSSLWSSGEWRRHLLAGAAQAFCTRLPEVTFAQTLNDAIASIPAEAVRIALDNYESPASIAHTLKPLSTANAGSSAALPVVLAVGSERGWTGTERDLLRAKSFALAHLGSRVLRTETAVVAAVAIVTSMRGWL